MSGFALLVATAVVGVDYGWQPDAEGQLEYIIQIEPVTLIALRGDRDIVSQIDPYVQNVRRFRIRVGTEPVPRRGLPPREPSQDASPPAPPGVEYGWRVDQGQVEFIVQISPERLEKLNNDEEISGQIPTGLRNVASIRVRCGTEAVPTDELPPVSGGTSGANAAVGDGPTSVDAAMSTAGESPAPGQPDGTATRTVPDLSIRSGGASENTNASTESATVPRESIWPPRSGQSDWRNLPLTGASEDPARAAVSVGDGQTANSAMTSPPPTVGSEGSARVGDPRQSIVDRPREGLLYRETPREEIPLSSLPVPGIDTSQSGPITRPGTFDRERSVYGQGSQGMNLSNGGATVPPEVPKRFDPNQPAGPPTVYAPNPRDEFAPLASQPNSPRPSSPWADPGGVTPNASFVASASRDLISDFGTAAEDREYYGIPDSLASALGYKPWPNRVVSYDMEVKPEAAPKNFWSNLSNSANDPSLAYLDQDADSTGGENRWWPLTLAVLALFASMGGNLYMGWIVAGTYRKYLDLTDDVDGEDRHEPAEDEPEEDSWVRRRSRRERRTAGV